MSVLKKILSGKKLKASDKHKVLATDKNLAIINAPSLTDLLPVKQYAGDGIFVFRDLKNVGAMLTFKPINLEAKSTQDKEDLLSGINFAMQNAIPMEYEDHWHSQLFISKTNTKDDLIKSVKNHTKVDTKFSKHWHGVLEEHLEDLANPNGAFIDKNTGVKFSIAKLEITMCVWQELAVKNKQTIDDRIKITKEVLDRLTSALEQINIKVQTFNSQNYIDNLGAFFHQEKINYKPKPLQLVDSDLTQTALGKTNINIKDSTFSFTNNNKTKHSVFLALEEINQKIKLGHITAEQKDRTSIFDKLPIGSVWSQTTVHIHKDKITEELVKINKKSLGTEPDIINNKNAINQAIEDIAAGNNICRIASGVYLSTDDTTKLDSLIRNTKSILGAKGLQVLDLSHNPTSGQDFISNLPFAFSYEQDKRYFNKRAILQDVSSISKLSPWVGRGTGTGSAGLIKFNRGGEPLLFDPLADRTNNAYGLVLGPMGSGKSAFLVDFLMNMISTYNPRVFIIEKGNSFGLLVDHCKNMGLSTNRIAITAGSKDVKLPPFADAIKLLDKNTSDELDGRDLLGELLIVAKLMITGGEEAEEKKFAREDWDTVAQAIKLAAQITKDDNRKTTLTEDVVKALEQLSNQDGLLNDEKIKIRKMTKAMKVFLNTDFSNRIFNTEGSLFPEVDITQLDVGILGDEGYQDKLAVAFISMMGNINRIAERTQFDDRPILILVDEAHLITTNPLLAPYVAKIAKMWRKLGAWLWLATQTLDDYKDASKQMLKVMEWWICLSFKPAEAESMKRFRKLSKEQEELLLSSVNASGQYKEGVVFSENMQTLIRNIPPPLALALAQTEDFEKANRKKIMDEFGCTEIEAVYKVAEKISQSRKGQGV